MSETRPVKSSQRTYLPSRLSRRAGGFASFILRYSSHSQAVLPIRSEPRQRPLLTERHAHAKFDVVWVAGGIRCDALSESLEIAAQGHVF